MTAESEDAQRIADLVTANHILAQQGVLDGFGHVSVRSAANTNEFYMSRRTAPALVTVDGIVKLNQESEPVDARVRQSGIGLANVDFEWYGGAVYGERYIHGEVYRRRPDVHAVVHSHSLSVIPFGVSTVTLRPVMHMAGFLPAESPIFEIRDVQTNGGMLVLTNALGAALADALGSAPIVLMRGHGDTVVGSSMKEAVFRAIYAELNARVQMEAMRLGGQVNYLNAAELAFNIREIFDFDRPWDIWKRLAEAGTR